MVCLSSVRMGAAVLAATILASTLAGCGRRGALEPAPDPSVQAAGNTADASPQAGLKRPKRVPIKPPHEPFLLDPLL